MRSPPLVPVGRPAAPSVHRLVTSSEIRHSSILDHDQYAGTVVVAVLPQTPVPVCSTLRIPGGPRQRALLILSLPGGALPV